MIVSFADKGTEDVFNGRRTRDSKRVCPPILWKVARRKLDQLDSVNALHELRIPPGNRLELLRGDRQGQYSIRVNDQFRIVFAWTDSGPVGVTITDYH
jgi:proteic killer suppression protein